MIGLSLSRSMEKLLVFEIVGISSNISSVGLSSRMFCFVHLQMEMFYNNTEEKGMDPSKVCSVIQQKNPFLGLCY